LGQTVLDAVDISELAVEDDFMIGVGEWNPCTGRGRRGLDTEERIEGVGNALDLFHLEILNGTKVKDRAVCGANLKESRGYNQSEKKSRGVGGKKGSHDHSYHVEGDIRQDVVIELKASIERATYQGSVCNWSYAIFQFPVEEIAETFVLRQVLSFYLVQVAAEDLCVKPDAVGSKPNRQLERIDVPPQP
jgi:hypothetical protein